MGCSFIEQRILANDRCCLTVLALPGSHCFREIAGQRQHSELCDRAPYSPDGVFRLSSCSQPSGTLAGPWATATSTYSTSLEDLDSIVFDLFCSSLFISFFKEYQTTLALILRLLHVVKYGKPLKSKRDNIRTMLLVWSRLCPLGVSVLPDK